MAFTEFDLAVFPYSVQCASFGDYHRYWNDRENRIKNPAFDRHSNMLLSLKQKDNRQFREAVNYCASHVVEALNAVGSPVEFVIVPSRTAGKVSDGLVAIVNAACKANRRFSYRPGSLVRTRTIEKLATGGNRSRAVHTNSLRYVESATAPATKVVIDDIMTTGNSISAAVLLIKAQRPEAQVFAMVLGRTVHD